MVGTGVETGRTARALVARADRIAGFTGAGISTESGIPDFRSPDGIWARNRTVTLQEFLANEADREEYWRQKVAAWPAMRDAQPNAGHEAFATLHRQGRLIAMITQNIDGLHQRSGIPDAAVLELHGTTVEAACLDCGGRIPMDEAARRVAGGEGAPRCRACGGLLKPATISFGQMLPFDVLADAQRAAERCDLLLAVGSSLVVEPAASIPRLARAAGAQLVIVNREPTPLDRLADAVVREEIGAVLPDLVCRGNAAGLPNPDGPDPELSPRGGSGKRG